MSKPVEKIIAAYKKRISPNKTVRLNTLTKWPHVHICLLDLGCWHDMWQYGAPMRVHYKKKFWTIPGPVRWLSEYRSNKVWDWAHPHITEPPP